MTRPAPPWLAALAFPLALALAACQTQGEEPDAPDSAVTSPPMTGEPTTAAPAPDTATASAQDQADAADGCGAGKATRFVGQNASAEVRAALLAAAGGPTTRWLYPDSMVTEDFSPSRLNVMLDHGSERIVSLRCG